MSYKVKITAGGESLWIADDQENGFTSNEAEAAVFSDSFAQFNRFVLSEVEHLDFFDGKTYTEMGLEKIEFIYQ